MVNFNSLLSDEIDQDASTTVTHLCIILQFLLTKEMIYPYLTTMWDHMDGGAKQYRCASYIYLLSCFSLEFSIIIDRSVRSPGYGGNVIDYMNARDKHMLKLSMVNILNTELIRDDPIFPRLCKFMKMKKIKMLLNVCYSPSILGIQRTTDDKKTKFSYCYYHIQDNIYVQHKNVNTTGKYWKFPRHLVAADNFETRGRNTILFHYHYRVDT